MFWRLFANHPAPTESPRSPLPTSIMKNNKLGIYLSGIGGFSALATTSDAAIVVLDVSSISGPNAGLASSSKSNVPLSTLDPGLDGTIGLWNDAGDPKTGPYYTGITGSSGATIAVNPFPFVASPRNFSAGELIGPAAAFTADEGWSAFQVRTAGYFDYYGYVYYPGSLYQSPDFLAGAFIGFRDANARHGWLEVTWDSASQTFEIMAGAYESDPGVGILAGTVPEPSRMLLLVLGIGAACGVRRRKQATASA